MLPVLLLQLQLHLLGLVDVHVVDVEERSDVDEMRPHAVCHRLGVGGGVERRLAAVVVVVVVAAAAMPLAGNLVFVGRIERLEIVIVIIIVVVVVVVLVVVVVVEAVVE